MTLYFIVKIKNNWAKIYSSLLHA